MLPVHVSKSSENKGREAKLITVYLLRVPAMPASRFVKLAMFVHTAARD